MARLPDPAVRRRWEKLVRWFERSNLTVAEFCAEHGVSSASFYLWRRKIRDQSEDAGVFVPVSVEPSSECVRIRLGLHAVVEIPSSETSTLLAVVEQLNATVVRQGPQSC